jgi:Exocyst complex component Sec5
VHADTGMNKFRSALDKLKSQQVTGGNDMVKVKLIIENYDSFLEAKKVLDSINNKFADADQTRDQLKKLESTMLVLR